MTAGRRDNTAARNRMAVAAGALRMASGVSFLIAPEKANVLWGGEADDSPTASLLLRSMGYRDALVGGMLLRAGMRGDDTTAGWFLASAGADLADLVGGIANHDRLPEKSRTRGIGGAVAGVAIGAMGALLARRAASR
jgi:uncharacterized protein DUF4267